MTSNSFNSCGVQSLCTRKFGMLPNFETTHCKGVLVPEHVHSLVHQHQFHFLYYPNHSYTSLQQAVGTAFGCLRMTANDYSNFLETRKGSYLSGEMSGSSTSSTRTHNASVNISPHALYSLVVDRASSGNTGVL